MGRSNLLGDVLNQRCAVSLASCTRPGAEVDQVVALVVSLAKDITLGVVEKRQEFGEEASTTIARELIVKTPESAAEERAPGVGVFARGEPDGLLVVLERRALVTYQIATLA